MHKKHVEEDVEIISKYREEPNEAKLLIFWFLGSLLMFAGSWIAGHVEWVYGTTPFSYWFSIILSIILFLAGSFLIIAIAVIIARYK